MYRPFVFVGLGGSGGKTLRFLKQATLRWLREHDPDVSRLPEGWQLLHIDTPTIQDGQELNMFVPPLDASEYAGLVGDGVTFRSVSNALDVTEGMLHELAGWRIRPEDLNVPIGEGAGKFRAVGRTVAMKQGAGIRRRLEQTFDRVKSPLARAEMAALYERVTNLPPGNAYPSPIVIVVSSLAGGTGAGLLINVCDLIEELGSSDTTIGVLYTPEVFAGSGGGGSGVYANSLAAISELLNGHWLHGMGIGEDALVKSRNGADMRSAGAPRALGRTGPSYPFLVGMRNSSGVAFASGASLFETMGNALMSWLTQLQVQDQVLAYAKTNWQDAALENDPPVDVLVNRGSESEKAPPAFNALGVARVGIGTEYFERYCAERLAFDAARFVARAHVESDAAAALIRQEGTREPDALATRLADQQLFWFLKQTGLSELGPEDDVISALRPDAGELIMSARDEAYRLGQVGAGGNASVQAWTERLVPAVRAANSTFGTGYLVALHKKVAEWVSSAPQRVVAAVEESITQHGMRVASALLRQAAAQLRNEVVPELRGPTELGVYTEWGSEARWSQAIAGRLQSLNGQVSGTHPALAEAVEEGINSAQYRGEALLREQAAAVLELFAEDFLTPLADDLRSASEALDVSLQGDVANWAQWQDGAPPDHLLPPQSSLILLEPSSFGSMFTQLLTESFRDASEGERRLKARREVTTGGFIREQPRARQADAVPALRVSTEWWPGTTVIADVSRPRTRAVFSVAMSPAALHGRAVSWLNRPSSPFANMFRETLRTYLQRDNTFTANAQPAEVYAQRQGAFIAKLGAAIAASAPLVNLHTGLLSMLHPAIESHPSHPIISPLPFKNHELEQRVLSVLVGPNVYAGNTIAASELLDTDANRKWVDISSYLRKPVSPLVIDSIFDPISDHWAQVAPNRGMVQNFWRWRRARRLEEFVPAPQEHIIAMARGWFTGVALGIIDRHSTPVRIGRHDDDPALFPRYSLSSANSNRDQLPVILESLSLAYVETNRTGDLVPLHAYRAIRDLGRSGGSESLLDYDEISREIDQWASSGTSVGGIAGALVNGSDRLERLTSLHTLFDGTLEEYRTHLDETTGVWARDLSRVGSAPHWIGLSHQIDTSLSQLVSALSSAIGRCGTAGGGTGL